MCELNAVKHSTNISKLTHKGVFIFNTTVYPAQQKPK
jgi:hypothetical protein